MTKRIGLHWFFQLIPDLCIDSVEGVAATHAESIARQLNALPRQRKPHPKRRPVERFRIDL